MEKVTERLEPVLHLFERFVEDMKRTLPPDKTDALQIAMLQKLLIDISATTAASFAMPAQIFVMLCAGAIAEAIAEQHRTEAKRRSETPAETPAPARAPVLVERELTEAERAEILLRLRDHLHVH